MLHYFDPTTKGNENYWASIEDKHEVLNKTKAPRILIAGGSNMAFGINSALIESDFDMPVINLAIHEDLGLNFIAKELEKNIQKGDVAILGLEYQANNSGKTEAKGLAYKFAKDTDWSLGNFFFGIKSHAFNLFKSLLYYLGNYSESYNYKLLSRKNFNKKGDFEGHFGQNKLFILDSLTPIDDDFDSKISKLNKLNESVLNKGATIYFVYPCLAESAFEKNYEILDNIHQELIKELKMPILGIPQDFVLDDGYFYDNIYHTDKKGRQIRTSRLISLLEDTGL
ncbi:MAG: hypothetical protein KA327_02955 [Pseudarcicella sp.]|nr:hypothetical protein [Pseudarcicella sp.]